MDDVTKVGEKKIDAYLGDLKPLFLEQCRVQGISASEGLRRLVVAALSSDEPSFRVEVEPREALSASILIRVTPSELAAARSCAMVSGLSLQKWVGALLRGYLTRLPQFGQQELELLGESNRRLAILARNLREFVTIADGRETVDATLTEIKDHIRQVALVMVGNRERWRVSTDDRPK